MLVRALGGWCYPSERFPSLVVVYIVLLLVVFGNDRILFAACLLFADGCFLLYSRVVASDVLMNFLRVARSIPARIPGVSQTPCELSLP